MNAPADDPAHVPSLPPVSDAPSETLPRASAGAQDRVEGVSPVAVTVENDSQRPGAIARILLLTGALVAVALGVYAHAHSPPGRPLFTLVLSGMLQMKAWLTTVGPVLVGGRLVTALWMWGR